MLEKGEHIDGGSPAIVEGVSPPDSQMTRALIVGITGLSGSYVGQALAAEGHEVVGLSRSAGTGDRAHVQADLLDASSVRRALTAISPTHVFYCTWARGATEAESCLLNELMIKNVLDSVDGDALEHVALVTGLKHYQGPFEAYAKNPVETPLRETHPRLPYPNFYYVLEDILVRRAVERGFSWAVHRPHTMIGSTVGNAMNMAVTLSVYGALCQETGRPFAFPGGPTQYHGLTDVTDARVLAAQMLWAARTRAAANRAFNVTNGDVFRWREMWPVLAEVLGVEAAEYPGRADPLEGQMADMADVWEAMVLRHELQPTSLSAIASWWHSDMDLGRQVETVTDMAASRSLGFRVWQDSRDSFRTVVRALRQRRIIP